MLRSVDHHLAHGLELVAYIADDGLSDEQKAKAVSSLSERCTIHWVRPRPLERSLPTWGRMPLTTYLKLSIGDWLPASVERVLWLDCDVLALSDLVRLWELPTGDRIALAARDPLVPRLGSRFGVAAWRELGLDPFAAYFNAGVMLIDLARWRNEDVAERSADYLRRFGDRVVFWDQEALNAVLAGRWAELDLRWNRNPILHRLFATEAQAAAGEPWAVHFSGRLKPWTCPASSEYQAAFEACLDTTPWAGWRPQRTWRRTLLARYAVSPLRRKVFPLEQEWTAIVRYLTRRRLADG